mgnify:CR=1 FL=1
MIVLENVAKSFGSHSVLSGVSLEIPDGENTVVIGASGAGKGSVLWSLIRALAPLVAQRSVELWVIDPTSGADVWRAPRMYGQIQRNSLRYIDLNRDGTKEIVFATSLGMYRTR